MRFQTPQFIDVEDKIFGPLTLKQFIYLAGGLAVIYFLYKFLPFYVSIPIIIPVAAFACALAFFKINNKPFIFMVEAAIKYVTANRLYIWKKVPHATSGNGEEEEGSNASLYVPHLSNSKLRDLSWSLDVKQSLNPAISKDNKTNT